ncbi:MAG: hypothetical protein H5U38_15745, partial [Calditrichaeota bacterium]|nr:hypothetical protein [Calditrichota bacterium]
RALSLAGVILLVFQPVLELLLAKREKPLLPVLVDRSASMGLVDDSGARPQQVASVLGSKQLRSLAERARTRFYLFSSGLDGEFQPGQDSLRFEGLGTNLEAALTQLREQLRGQPVAGVVIITDGAVNVGERLARLGEKSAWPLFPVAVGSSNPPRDLIVHSALANEVTYVGSEVAVEVRLLNRGFDQANVIVELQAEGQVLDRCTVPLAGNQPETQVTLRFRPEAPGSRRYVVTLSHLPGEQTYENNRAEFVVKALASKMKVVLLAGRPSHDVVFLGKALQADANVAAQIYVCRKGSGFYRASPQSLTQALQEADCALLVDFPATGTDGALVAEVARAIRARRLPLFWAGGEDIDLAQLAALWEDLPLNGPPRVRGPELRTVRMQNVPFHPLTAVAESGPTNAAAWEGLPPVSSSFSEVPLWPNSEVLAFGAEPSARVGSGVPLIVVRQTPESRSVALLASGFWRWDLMMWGIGKDNALFLTFVKNIVRWLSLREEQKLFRVRTDREFYRSGEVITFVGQLYGPDLTPLEGAQVRARVNGPAGSKELVLEEAGAGRYEARTTADVEGDYNFVAEAIPRSGLGSADTGRFAVTRWSVEYLSTTSRIEELKQMATRSGGFMVPWNDLEPLAQGVPLRVVSRKSIVQFRYAGSEAVLALLVALLASEWFLRRRKGMV